MNAWTSVSVFRLVEREKRLTIKVGERKFSYRMVSNPIRSYRVKSLTINQNLTELLVCFMTLSIMIDAKRSYKRPEATVKILISACSDLVGVTFVDSPIIDFILNYCQR